MFLPSFNFRSNLVDPRRVIVEPFPVLFSWRPWFKNRTYRQSGWFKPLNLDGIAGVCLSFESWLVRSRVLSRFPGTLVSCSFLCGLRGPSFMTDTERSRFRSLALAVRASWFLALPSSPRPSSVMLGHITLKWPKHLQTLHSLNRAGQSSRP